MSIYQAWHDTHPQSATVNTWFMVFCTSNLTKVMQLPLQGSIISQSQNHTVNEAGKQAQAQAGKTFTWKSYR